MGAFFLGALRCVFGTPASEEFTVWGAGVGFAGVGACLRELKEDINSIDWGDSPRRLVKCDTASCFERVLA